MLSRRFDNSENAAMVDKVKGQNGADGDADVDGVVVVKVGLKIGRKMVVKRGNSSKLLSFFFLPFFPNVQKIFFFFFRNKYDSNNNVGLLSWCWWCWWCW